LVLPSFFNLLWCWSCFEYIQAKNIYGGAELSFRTMTDGIAQGVLGKMLSLRQFIDIGTIFFGKIDMQMSLG
jgi:hypothetical protein